MLSLIPSKGDFPHDEGKHLTLVLSMWAFGDECGGMDTRYCLLGGYVASERQWKLFRREWAAVLNRENVPVFHAVEFFQPATVDSRKSPYKDWTMARRKRFLAALLDVAQRHPAIHPIGTIVDVADFFALHPDLRRVETGALLLWKLKLNPTAASDNELIQVDVRHYKTTGTETRPYAASFFNFIREGLVHTPEGAKLHIMLDLNTVEQGLAEVNHAQLRKRQQLEGWEKLGGLHYEASIDHAPLQFADLYAYVLIDWVAKDGNVGILLRQAADVLIGKKKRKIQFRDAAAFEADFQALDKMVMDAVTKDIEETVG